jgi:hypothetical protein
MTSGRMTMAGRLWRCVACRFHRWLRAAALLSGLAFSSAVLADSPGESRDYLDVVLPVAHEIREVRLAQAGSLAGAETARSISVTRTRNGEVTSFQAAETRPWSPATSSMSRGCFPASCATKALRPGNLVYKIVKWERQRQRDRLVWLPPSS